MEKNMPTGDPLVSIRCLVYNHEPFLRQCLDGFVMQKTTFPFEAIVHDDASTDGSAAIIREYAEKYPDIIKPIYETENQFSKHDGSITRAMDEAMHPGSKYIAKCEGDDYWTDPNKLQLQVDFLESHPDYVMTSHDFSVFNEKKRSFENEGQDRFKNISCETFHGIDYHTFDLDDFLQMWIASTLTVVYRRIEYYSNDIRRQYHSMPDFIFFYYILKKGKCAFVKRNMATYRVHNGGIYSGSRTSDWCEFYLDRSYVLYRLENDNRIVHKLERHFKRLVVQLILQKRFIRILNASVKHSKNVSLSNTLKCFVDLSKMFYKKVLFGETLDI